MGTTLTGKRVQNTYDSLLKLSDNDNLTGVAKIVGDGLGNNSPIYLSTTQIGIGVTPSYEFHTNSHAKIGGNLIVGGNLTVDGTTTIVDSTVVAIGDNMIELAKDNVANVKDIGWYGTINSSGEKYVGMFYDASDGITVPTFRVGLGTSEPGSTMTITTKGKLVIGALDASTGVFSGQVTIPATPVSSTDAASKGYVDSQITAQDLDIAGDSGTGAVDLDSQTFTISGGTNVTTSVSGQTVTINASGGIDGSGTANDVVMWQDSDTLTDAPIAISGNNATFAGNISVADSVTVTGSGYGSLELGGPSGGYIDLKAPASDDYDIRIITSSGGNEITTASGDLKINTGNTLALTLDGSTQDATFANDVILSSGELFITGSSGTNTVAKFESGSSSTTSYIQILPNGATDTNSGYIGYDTSNNLKLFTVNTLALTINSSQNATFAGTISANKRILVTTDGTYAYGINVSSSDQSHSRIRITNTGSGGETYSIMVGTHGVNNSGFAIRNETDSTTPLQFDTNDNATFGGSVTIGTSTTTPSVHYDNLVIEDVAGNNVGISLISGTGNNTALYFGDSADTDVGQLKYSHATNDMFFVVNASAAMTINSSGNATFAGSITATGNITTDGIFVNENAPDSDVVQFIQNGRKTSLKTYFASSSTGSYLDFNISDGTTNGGTNHMLRIYATDAVFYGDVILGNTVNNPATGFADQSGIGLQYSGTVPKIEVSSDAEALSLNRTTTGGEGVIADFRYESNSKVNIKTNKVEMFSPTMGTYTRLGVAFDLTGSAANLSESVNYSTVALSPLRNGSSYGMYFGNANTSVGYIQLSNTAGNATGSLNLQPFGGSVGIGQGSSAPGSTLHVVGSFRTDLDSTYHQGILNEYVSTYVSRTKFGRVGTTSNLEIYYDIAGTEEARITRNYTSATLKFMRGTTTDLEINGSGNATFGGTAAFASNISAPVVQANVINNQANSANIIYRSGTQTIVGGGSSTQKVKIEDNGTTYVQGEIHNEMAAPKIRLKPTTQNNASIIELGVLNGGTNAYARIDAINLFNYDSNLRFWTNEISSTTQVERMRIDSSGRVGIGVSPSHLLHIKKPSSGDAAIMLETVTGGDPTIIFNSAAANRSGMIKYQDNGTNIGRIEYVHNGDRIDFQAGSATGQTMSIKNGAVGIGGTPSYLFHVIDTSYVANNIPKMVIRHGTAPSTVGYDTMVISAQDVPTLVLTETDSSGEQKLSFAVGDNKAVIGTANTSAGMYFNVARSLTAYGYDQSNGIQALHLSNAGDATFAGNIFGNDRLYLAGIMALDVNGTDLYVGATTSANHNDQILMRTNDANRFIIKSDGAFEFTNQFWNWTALGSDTFTQAALYYDSSNGWLLENSWTTNSTSGARRPLVLTWRGGFGYGGIKLTGNTQLFTDNTGLGINRTNPSYLLDAYGQARITDSSNNGILYLGETANTRAARVYGRRSPSYSSTGKLQFDVTTWGAGSDYGPTELMNIEIVGPDTKKGFVRMMPHDGYLQLGGGSAYTGTGVSSITINDDNYPLLALGSTSANRSSLISYSTYNLFTSANNMVFDSRFVGIREYSPNAYLHVTGKASYTTANSSEVSGLEFIRLQPNSNSEHSLWIHNASNNLGISGYSDAATSSTRDITLQTYGGRVGIGVASPDFELEVAGSIGIDDYIYHNGDHNTYIRAMGDAWVFRTGGDDRMKILNTGVQVGPNGADSISLNDGPLRVSNNSTGNSAMVRASNAIQLGPSTTRSAVSGYYYGGITWNGLMNYTNGTGYDIAPHVWLGSKYHDFPGSERSKFCIGVKSGTGTSGSGNDVPVERLTIDYSGTLTMTGDIVAFSDGRLKDNVKTIDNALDKVNKLRGVSYVRNDIEDDAEKIGVIAQEVIEVLPQVVKHDIDEDKYSVAYGNMAGVFIEAIKELTAKVEELENKCCNCK